MWQHSICHKIPHQHSPVKYSWIRRIANKPRHAHKSDASAPLSVCVVFYWFLIVRNFPASGWCVFRRHFSSFNISGVLKISVPEPGLFRKGKTQVIFIFRKHSRVRARDDSCREGRTSSARLSDSWLKWKKSLPELIFNRGANAIFTRHLPPYHSNVIHSISFGKALSSVETPSKLIMLLY